MGKQEYGNCIVAIGRPGIEDIVVDSVKVKVIEKGVESSGELEFEAQSVDEGLLVMIKDVPIERADEPVVSYTYTNLYTRESSD